VSEPRILPAADPRVETGTVQFGEDWPGLFIRGDNAFWYAQCLHWAIVELEEELGYHQVGGTGAGMELLRMGALKELLRDLRATRVKPRGE